MLLVAFCFTTSVCKELLCDVALTSAFLVYALLCSAVRCLCFVALRSAVFLPCPGLLGLTLPRHAPRCPALPGVALLWLALPCLALPCPALPCLDSSCFVIQCVALRCFALLCLALPIFPSLFCLALRCFSLVCIVLFRNASRCILLLCLT